MSIEKDREAEELIRFHFEIDPEKSKIIRFISKDEDDPREPIKLLEVTAATIKTGEVQAFGFSPAKGFNCSLILAEVTPSEFRKIKKGEIPLPKDWKRRRRQEYNRNDVFATSSGK